MRTHDFFVDNLWPKRQRDAQPISLSVSQFEQSNELSHEFLRSNSSGMSSWRVNMHERLVAINGALNWTTSYKMNKIIPHAVKRIILAYYMSLSENMYAQSGSLVGEHILWNDRRFLEVLFQPLSALLRLNGYLVPSWLTLGYLLR